MRTKVMAKKVKIMEFKKVGTVSKKYEALVLDVEGWKLGQIVIGAENAQRLLRGTEVEINFVQNEFIGYAGRAKLSFSRKAVNLYLVDMGLLTVSLVAFTDVLRGRRKTAHISRPIPKAQPKKDQIDSDLEKSF